MSGVTTRGIKHDNDKRGLELPRVLVFLFFQAEDGIRDIGVTGVQTCALPIWYREGSSAELCAPARGRPWRSECSALRSSAECSWPGCCRRWRHPREWPRISGD